MTTQDERHRRADQILAEIDEVTAAEPTEDLRAVAHEEYPELRPGQTEDVAVPEQPTEPILLRYDPFMGMVPADDVEEEDARERRAARIAAEEQAREVASLSDEELLRRQIIDDQLAAGEQAYRAAAANAAAELERRAHERRTQQAALEYAEKIRAYYARYLVFPAKFRDFYLDVLTVWNIHTYAYSLQGVTPYLAIIAPTRGAGKTTVGSVLSTTVANPSAIESDPTPAVIRLFASEGRTTFVDEVDQLATDKAFTAIANSGYKTGGSVTRVGRVKGGDEARHSSTFCPKVFMGIAAEGRLPLSEPTLDRCIDIRIIRAKPGEITKRFRPDIMRDEPEVQAMRDWASQWVRVMRQEIRDAYFDLPTLGDSREQEIWEPLITIAGLLGGDWYDRICAAARAISASGSQTVDPNVALVHDVKRVVEAYREVAPDATQIRLTDLVDLRNSLTGRELQQKLSAEQFARRLGAFGIKPVLAEIASEDVQVYHVAGNDGKLYDDWDDLFSRYV